MFGWFRRWMGKRREMRRLWQADARQLIGLDERSAYYTAQRLAARSRASGDVVSFFHWAKVAAEVARLSPVAEMNLAVVESIVSEELAAGRKSGQPGRY